MERFYEIILLQYVKLKVCGTYTYDEIVIL
jgi:hypothetical protein